MKKFHFRPRVGMGWFRWKETETVKNLYSVFVPAWGWVGSAKGCQLLLDLGDFRPRLGMDWFRQVVSYLENQSDFRPRLGMGWFLTRRMY